MVGVGLELSSRSRASSSSATTRGSSASAYRPRRTAGAGKGTQAAVHRRAPLDPARSRPVTSSAPTSARAPRSAFEAKALHGRRASWYRTRSPSRWPEDRLAEPDAARASCSTASRETWRQAEALDGILADSGDRARRVLDLVVAEDEVVRRICRPPVCRNGGHVCHVTTTRRPRASATTAAASSSSAPTTQRRRSASGWRSTPARPRRSSATTRTGSCGHHSGTGGAEVTSGPSTRSRQAAAAERRRGPGAQAVQRRGAPRGGPCCGKPARP